MCNVNTVTRSDKYTKNSHPTAAPFSSTEIFSIFQLIVLVLQPTAVPCWTTSNALINLISSHSCFLHKTSDKPTVR